MRLRLAVTTNNLVAHLYFNYDLDLEEFGIGISVKVAYDNESSDYYYIMRVSVEGNKDEISVSYNAYSKGLCYISISVRRQGDEENFNLLENFNKEVTEKYKEKIENRTISKAEVKDFIDKLLDYVDWFTDNRAHDLIQKFKDELKKEIDIDIQLWR